MECRYFKCQPIKHALCCLNTNLSLSLNEFKEHRGKLNPNGIILPTTAGFHHKEVVEQLTKLFGEFFGETAYLIDLGKLLKYLEKEDIKKFELDKLRNYYLVIDVLYIPLTPVKPETAEYLKSIGMENTTKCPYYNEETGKCDNYENRFDMCRLFPRFEFSQKISKTLENFGLGKIANVKNEFLKLCKKCNPQSCSNKPIKGGKSVEEIIREEKQLRLRMEEERKEFEKFLEEILANYFVFIGEWIIYDIQTKQGRGLYEIAQAFENLRGDLLVSFLQMLLMAGNLIVLPFNEVLIAYLYKKLDWSVEKSLSAIKCYKEFASENNYERDIRFAEQIEKSFKEVEKIARNLHYLDLENVSALGNQSRMLLRRDLITSLEILAKVL
jgi:Fe-S-cluster containining protein